jgi:hypothetical protein
MGFWHTGYMEFHEATGEGGFRPEPAGLPAYTCPHCGLVFTSERDYRVHAFEGHATPRPLLVFMGRECGRSRLTVTSETTGADWVIKNAEHALVNRAPMSAADASTFLASQRSGVADLQLANGNVTQSFQFEFALAEAEDLQAVDDALERFFAAGDLSLGAIDAFIMRSRRYPSAAKYTDGLANYLYGVLAREGAVESSLAGKAGEEGYEGKYDRAVGILGSFDRPPAEAISGLVAFHYNQFERAMTRTRSQRVAEVSLRFQSILRGEPWTVGDLSERAHSSVDSALSDSVVERILGWSAIPLDGSASRQVREIEAEVARQRPSDALKLHLIAAEHFLAAGDGARASKHAEVVRHSPRAEVWYTACRNRLQREPDR